MSTETDKPTPESTGDPKARTRAEVKAKRAERREERQAARAEKAAAKATAAEEKQKAKAEKSAGKPSGASSTKEKKGGSAGPAIKNGLDSLRTLLGQVVWIAAVVCALFLAVGALCIALDANRDNPLVSFVLEGAETVSLGVFSVRGDGVFDFVGANSQIKNALVNYGLGALLYLVVGRIVERVLRP